MQVGVWETFVGCQRCVAIRPILLSMALATGWEPTNLWPVRSLFRLAPRRSFSTSFFVVEGGFVAWGWLSAVCLGLRRVRLLRSVRRIGKFRSSGFSGTSSFGWPVLAFDGVPWRAQSEWVGAGTTPKTAFNHTFRVSSVSKTTILLKLKYH